MNLAKKTLLIIKDGLEIGGVETLMLRMARWCNDNGHRCIWAKTEYAKIDEQMMKGIMESNVEIVELKKMLNNSMGCAKFYNLKDVSFTFSAGEEVTIVSFDQLTFVIGEAIKDKYDNTIDNILYVPHPWNSYRDTRISRRINIIKTCYYRFYRKIAISMVDNNNLVFMDETTRNYFSRHYNYDINMHKWPIIRLAHDIIPYDENLIKSKVTRSPFVILSIGRFDFPFKAYIFGVIDCFHEMQKTRKNVKLRIIGYGPGEQEIIDKLSHLPMSTTKNIEIVGKIDYHKLPPFLKEANAFIGVGTTLLDAANYGVPSIIGVPYQYNSLSNGFFHEHPTVLGEVDQKGISTLDADLKKLMIIGNEEYEEACALTHKALCQNYDVNAVMPKLLGTKNINRKQSTIAKTQMNTMSFFAPLVTFCTLLVIKYWRTKGLR